jgi:hypothetical protein
MNTTSLLLAVSLVALGACSSSSSEGTGSKGNDPPSPPVAPTTTSTATAPPTTTATTPPVNAGGEYTMLFEGFSTVAGKDGLPIGSTTNLRFALDLQKKERTYTPPPASSAFNAGNGTGEVTPKLITRFELGGYCNSWAKQYGKLELPPGDTAWVESVDLTMTSLAPLPADGSAPEKSNSNGMCYGYRLSGAWYWDTEPRTATWDAATSTYRLKLTIDKGPIDAIKILSNNGQAPRYLDRMVLTTKPQ